MRRHFLFFIPFFVLFGSTTNAPAAPVVKPPITKPDPPPAIVLAGAARRLNQPAGQPPSSFQMWSSQRVKRGEFFTRAAASFLLTASDAMVEQATRTLAGQEVTVFQLASNGIPVEGSSYALWQRAGYVAAGQGSLKPGLAIQPTPAMSETDARTAAMAAVNLGTSKWDWLANGAPPPAGRLVAFSKDNGATIPHRLAWKFLLVARGPRLERIVYVDAASGAILHLLDGSLRGPAPVSTDDRPGTGKTFKSTLVPITVQAFGAQYRLREVTTRKITSLASINPVTDYLDADTTWSDTNQIDAVSAHYAAEKFWDFLLARGLVGGGGVDGKGTAGTGITIVRNYDCSTNSGTRYFAADKVVAICPDDQGKRGVESDVMGHELGHAIIDSFNIDHPNMVQLLAGYHSNFPESLGAGTIHEGVANIIGNSFTAWLTGNGNDWVVGEEQQPPLGQYNLAAPESQGRSGTVDDPWFTQAAQLNEPHLLVGPIDKWFYLLAAGGAGQNSLGTAYNVTGVGRATAETIVFASLPALTSNMTFTQFADATSAVAQVVYGQSSAQATAVCDAWKAVNVACAGPVPPGQYRSPEPFEIGVEPWPVTFEAQVPLIPRGRFPEMKWEMELSTTLDFSSNVTKFNLANTSPTRVKSGGVTLRPGTTYWWRARAFRNNAWDKTWAFTSGFQTSYQQPVNCSPGVHGPSVNPWPTTFSWSAVPGATSYLLEVALDSDFANPEVFTTSDTHKDVMTRADKLFQYWRVRASNGSYAGDWSSRIHAVDNQPNDPEKLETPWDAADALSFSPYHPVASTYQPGSPADPWNITFRWSDLHAAKYEFAIDTVNPPSLAAPTTVVTNTTARNLHTKSTYYWRVRATGPHGDVSLWGPVQTLTTSAAVPLLVSPRGAWKSVWPANFKWNWVTGALGYDVRIRNASAPGDVMNVWVGNVTNYTTWLYAVDLGSTDKYLWYVRAHGPNGDVGDEGTADFTPAAIVPTVSSPANGAAVDPGPVTFHWPSVPGAVSYYVTVTDRSSQTVVAQTVQHVTGTSYAPAVALAQGHQFQVELTAYSPIGTWTDTGVTYFTTKNPRPCNSQIMWGNDDPASFDIELGKTAGDVSVITNFKVIPDHMIFTFPGGTVYNTGCVSGSYAPPLIHYSGTTSIVHVDVYPNCIAQPDETYWDFTVSCP